MKRTNLLVVLVVAIGWASVALHAQTMYKCGTVYQDRPCASGTAGKAIGSTGTGGAAAPAPASAAQAECAQRGRDSLRIVWSREGGATLERVLSEASTPAQKRFVEDVYRRPGAASTVQVAVEADCIAEKQRLEQEAALAAAAAVLKAQREGAAPAAPAAPPPATYGSKEQLPAAEATDKKRQCAQYNAQLDRLRERERAGGSVAVMEAHAETRRELRRRMSEAGC